jgi:3-dehydroquinate synthase
MKAELAKFKLLNRKVAIVTDSNVGAYHIENLKNIVNKVAESCVTFTFLAGEENKNLSTVQSLYEFLIQHSFDRNDVLMALGGGVVGDLTGFTAATYLRGIRFFQVPTSLLAMVDSSIGGKTGVDFNAYKNMVGAFYMPCLVYINVPTLLTLPQREYISGMGEIIKHGLIKDASYYASLKQQATAICDKDLSVILPMVLRSCQIKREVVENDPKEQGERALLNFGHSIGHAVEKVMKFTLLHGECVAIGMVAATYISMERNMISQEEYEDIKQTIASFGFPICLPELKTNEVLAAMSKDKKVDAGKIKFILLSGIGKAVIDTTVSIEEMTRAIESIGATERVEL